MKSFQTSQGLQCAPLRSQKSESEREAYLPEDSILADSSSTLRCKLVVGDVQGNGHLVVLVTMLAVALAVPAMLAALVVVIVAVIIICVLVL